MEPVSSFSVGLGAGLDWPGVCGRRIVSRAFPARAASRAVGPFRETTYELDCRALAFQEAGRGTSMVLQRTAAIGLPADYFCRVSLDCVDRAGHVAFVCFGVSRRGERIRRAAIGAHAALFADGSAGTFSFGPHLDGDSCGILETCAGHDYRTRWRAMIAGRAAARWASSVDAGRLVASTEGGRNVARKGAPTGGREERA